MKKTKKRNFKLKKMGRFEKNQKKLLKFQKNSFKFENILVKIWKILKLKKQNASWNFNKKNRKFEKSEMEIGNGNRKWKLNFNKA